MGHFWSTYVQNTHDENENEKEEKYLSQILEEHEETIKSYSERNQASWQVKTYEMK